MIFKLQLQENVKYYLETRTTGNRDLLTLPEYMSSPTICVWFLMIL